ncbi:MAG: hypothetical protein ACMXYL_04675 [Candidatus Woesearchaeota archaeon]
MRHNRKGQAAMEFLMTYGWAILIVVIAIAALAAFGVFNRPVQEGCFMESATMACAGPVPAITDNAGNVRLQLALRNGGAARIEVTRVESVGDGTCTIAYPENDFQILDTDRDPLTEVARNQAFVLVIDCDDSYEENTDYQQTFRIVYDDDHGMEDLAVRVRAVAKT